MRRAREAVVADDPVRDEVARPRRDVVQGRLVAERLDRGHREPGRGLERRALRSTASTSRPDRPCAGSEGRRPRRRCRRTRHSSPRRSITRSGRQGGPARTSPRSRPLRNPPGTPRASSHPPFASNRPARNPLHQSALGARRHCDKVTARGAGRERFGRVGLGARRRPRRRRLGRAEAASPSRRVPTPATCREADAPGRGRLAARACRRAARETAPAHRRLSARRRGGPPRKQSAEVATTVLGGVRRRSGEPPGSHQPAVEGEVRTRASGRPAAVTWRHPSPVRKRWSPLVTSSVPSASDTRNAGFTVAQWSSTSVSA